MRDGAPHADGHGSDVGLLRADDLDEDGTVLTASPEQQLLLQQPEQQQQQLRGGKSSSGMHTPDLLADSPPDMDIDEAQAPDLALAAEGTPRKLFQESTLPPPLPQAAEDAADDSGERPMLLGDGDGDATADVPGPDVPDSAHAKLPALRTERGAAEGGQGSEEGAAAGAQLRGGSPARDARSPPQEQASAAHGCYSTLAAHEASGQQDPQGGSPVGHELPACFTSPPRPRRRSLSSPPPPSTAAGSPSQQLGSRFRLDPTSPPAAQHSPQGAVLQPPEAGAPPPPDAWASDERLPLHMYGSRGRRSSEGSSSSSSGSDRSSSSSGSGGGGSSPTALDLALPAVTEEESEALQQQQPQQQGRGGGGGGAQRTGLRELLAPVGGMLKGAFSGAAHKPAAEAAGEGGEQGAMAGPGSSGPGASGSGLTGGAEQPNGREGSLDHYLSAGGEPGEAAGEGAAMAPPAQQHAGLEACSSHAAQAGGSVGGAFTFRNMLGSPAASAPGAFGAATAEYVQTESSLFAPGGTSSGSGHAGAAPAPLQGSALSPHPVHSASQSADLGASHDSQVSAAAAGEGQAGSPGAAASSHTNGALETAAASPGKQAPQPSYGAAAQPQLAGPYKRWAPPRLPPCGHIPSDAWPTSRSSLHAEVLACTPDVCAEVVTCLFWTDFRQSACQAYAHAQVGGDGWCAGAARRI